MNEAEAQQPQSKGADIDLTLGGQRINVRNVKSLNTIATVATLVAVCTGFAWLYQGFQAHATDTKEASAAFVSAIKEQTAVQREQTQVMREGNCLNTYQGPPSEKASFCRQVTR